MSAKSPKSDYDKYTAIAAWYKQEHRIDEITADHVYSCFKFMNWPAPDDVSQPFRDLKSRKKYFDKGTGKNAYKINIIGLNNVDRMGGSD